MSLYNDGYSNHAVALSMGLGFGSATFTQTSTNNLVATDTIQVGNATFTIVSSIGSTPGNVLRGANWLATMQNVRDSLAASIVGGPATANYVPFALAANVEASVAGSVAVFKSLVPAVLNSVYTASGTSAGSFSAATFGSTTAAVTRAVDYSVANGLSVQFEVVAAIVNPAVFQVWSDIPSTGNPCVASGVSGNQVQMSDDDLCNPVSGAAIPMTVIIPATKAVSALNTQGFIGVQNVSPVGSFYVGRPRCPGPGKFIFVKGISGDIDFVNITLLLSRLKYTS